MSDIRCVVCGEPWDAYGVNHGDMLKWEAKLFKAGAGCPCCEGEPNGYEPTRLSDVENGDEDPMLRIQAREAHEEGKAPKWERPTDPLLWACDGCKIRVVRDVDTDEPSYEAPYGSRASYEYWWRNQDAPEKPEHTFTDTKWSDDIHVCERCYETCSECSTPIPPEEGYDDPSSDQYHDPKHVCSEECLSVVEEREAQRVWRDCYNNRERLEYMRSHWDQFEHCKAKYYPENAWHNLLDCVRGRVFYGYASELIAP